MYDFDAGEALLSIRDAVSFCSNMSEEELCVEPDFEKIPDWGKLLVKNERTTLTLTNEALEKVAEQKRRMAYELGTADEEGEPFVFPCRFGDDLDGMFDDDDDNDGGPFGLISDKYNMGVWKAMHPYDVDFHSPFCEISVSDNRFFGLEDIEDLLRQYDTAAVESEEE
jgi:hypothetical protein